MSDRFGAHNQRIAFKNNDFSKTDSERITPAHKFREDEKANEKSKEGEPENEKETRRDNFATEETVVKHPIDGIVEGWEPATQR